MDAPVKTAKPRRMPTPRSLLIAAGPTREHIDPVRYLSNDPSDHPYEPASC